tara:strand:+ start:57923 stop:58570 length:648 start_codon:yes stop_codon:yes gene_type:complete
MTVSLESVRTLRNQASKYFTDRESEFLGSLEKRLENGREPSWGQQRWYGDIARKYSPENLAAEMAWEHSFGPEERLIATRVATYYSANPPYFSNYVARIAEDPSGFFLSRTEWNKFCENKYALKIRSAYEQELKFKVGDCVQIRKTNKIPRSNYPRDLHPLGDKVAFILKTDAAPVTRAAKGSRVYSILLVGSSSAFNVYEADIKRAKKNHVKKN